MWAWEKPSEDAFGLNENACREPVPNNIQSEYLLAHNDVGAYRLR